jgi:hypothetical protein
MLTGLETWREKLTLNFFLTLYVIKKTDYFSPVEINLMEPVVTNILALNHSECWSFQISLFVLCVFNIIQELLEHDIDIQIIEPV